MEDKMKSLLCYHLSMYVSYAVGCKVMIASRKIDRLSQTGDEMKAMLPKSGPAQLEYMQCNIRSEESVRLSF